MRFSAHGFFCFADRINKMNGATGMSDIEGKATRAGASERGKQTSFKAIKVITSSSARLPLETADIRFRFGVNAKHSGEGNATAQHLCMYREKLVRQIAVDHTQ
jgi:hypothetical protein